MIKYTSFILVSLYTFLNSATVLVALSIVEWNVTRHHANMPLYWILFCQFFSFSAVYWWPDILLALMNVRPCMVEEEDLLHSCMREIQLKTGRCSNYCLFILEDDSLHAFALGQRTIIIPRGLLPLLTQPELCAILVHTIGHLRSKNAAAAAAFSATLFIPMQLRAAIRTGLRFPARLFRPRKYDGGKVPVSGWTILLVGLVFFYFGLWHDLVALVVILTPLAALDKLFLYLWKWNAAPVDYQQDKFAQEMGFGLALKDALLKIKDGPPTTAARFYPIIPADNPRNMYRRIRRLERLAGLRA